MKRAARFSWPLVILPRDFEQAIWFAQFGAVAARAKIRRPVNLLPSAAVNRLRRALTCSSCGKQANFYRWEIRARRSLAPPVHGTQARTDPPCLLSSLPQSRADWQPRGANRREKSAQQTDGRRPQNGV